MRQFPVLVPQDVRLEGLGYLEAAADIKLSSAGNHEAAVCCLGWSDSATFTPTTWDTRYVSPNEQ